MPTSNPLDILLAHDRWATRNILEACAALTAEPADPSKALEFVRSYTRIGLFGWAVRLDAPICIQVLGLPPEQAAAVKDRIEAIGQSMSLQLFSVYQTCGGFKNVQVLKGITAAQLVTKMDQEYGKAMSWNCTNCHRLAPQGNFASDTSNDKRRARFMQQMTDDINKVQLPKLYSKDTPHVTCMSWPHI